MATKWVTREHPKIDRIACPWLVRRFVDADAEFLYVPTDRVFSVAAETGAKDRDARCHCRQPVPAGPAGDPSRHLHLVHGGGFWGAWAGGWAFILPNFIIVAALGALYVHFGGLSWMTAIFYGVSPAVIALILYSCWRLAKLGMEDWVQWAVAAVSFGIAVAVQAEVAILPRAPFVAVAPPVAIGATPHTVSLPLVGKLLAFFLKAGALTFGSGLVIVPFLEKGLVQQRHRLNPREFLVAVAIGMMSPGPVVITATFVGYLVAGFWGSLVSTIGIFLPSFLLVPIAAPILLRHRENPNVQAFVKGAYAAAIGTILGASVLLTKIAIGDWLTALIAVGCLAVLFRFKVSNPALIGATAVIGLVAFPILRPAWVFVQ